MNPPPIAVGVFDTEPVSFFFEDLERHAVFYGKEYVVFCARPRADVAYGFCRDHGGQIPDQGTMNPPLVTLVIFESNPLTLSFQHPDRIVGFGLPQDVMGGSGPPSDIGDWPRNRQPFTAHSGLREANQVSIIRIIKQRQRSPGVVMDFIESLHCSAIEQSHYFSVYQSTKDRLGLSNRRMPSSFAACTAESSSSWEGRVASSGISAALPQGRYWAIIFT